MEKIRRSIKLFFVTYGNLILSIIGIFVGVIIFVQTLNNIVIEQEKNNTPTEEELIIQEKEKKEEETNIQFISKFIDYCNTGKIEEAYNMLSSECKEEKYNTIEDFEKEYINKKFKIRICDYNTIKQDEIYIVKLIQDFLIVGKENSTIEEKYKITGVLTPEIYIYN